MAEQTMSMTPKQLQDLITAAVTAAVAEAKKPYVSPQDERNEAQKIADRDRVIAEEDQRIANIKAVQDNCSHQDSHDKWAFGGQKNCLGKASILCTQCFKSFIEGTEDFAKIARYIKWDAIGNARG